ncbi:alpha/beta hydrolase [Actinomycetospora chiangmaiensis]|uniref:alpha/beta hydrolase n=1 Tax=Actinomycetospora chiangmaiensis TaxID=402650 RepID=UPI00036A0A86|nr:alpha/beta hydrolase-fold protein [Actinomycetospora chiangmaiensis]
MTALGVDRVLDVSLLVGVAPVLATACGAVALAGLLCGRHGARRSRVVPCAALAAAAAAALTALVVNVAWRPFPDVVPVAVFVWVGVAALGIGAALPWVRRGTVRRRITALVALVSVIGAAGIQVNVLYGYVPTVRTALGVSDSRDVDFAALPPPRPMRRARDVRSWRLPLWASRRGAVTHVDIPALESGFPARTASIYLPPAYAVTDHPALPVLVLIAGAPGYPQDWLTAGRLAEVGDGYAAAHEGLAPVVVLADGTGGVLDNPLCMDSRAGNAETYLARDVPQWVDGHLDVDHDPRHRAIGGFSYGGACALQLATRAPGTYPTFLAVSGQDEPSLDTHQETVALLFGGDETAFAARNPMELLRTRRYEASAGMVVSGRDDAVDRAAAGNVVAATRGAGMDVRAVDLVGGHTWAVAIEALRTALPWLASRNGLDGTDSAPAGPRRLLAHP